MLKKLNILIKSQSLQRCFSDPKKERTLLKICSMLKQPYYPLNDEITPNINVRLIEEPSGAFLGIQTIENALFSKKQTGKK